MTKVASSKEELKGLSHISSCSCCVSPDARHNMFHVRRKPSDRSQKTILDPEGGLGGPDPPWKITSYMGFYRN